MNYDKDTVLLEKYENYFHEELTFNENELKEVMDLAIQLERSHRAMDEETFKAKMRRFCELIMSGLFKQILKDSFDKYLKRM